MSFTSRALIFQCITELMAVNIAMNKNGKYCDVKDLSDIVFDGERDSNKFQTVADPCDVISSISINFGVMYIVNYAVVYQGLGK